MHARPLGATANRPARFPGCFDFFRCPDVGFRYLHVLFLTGNLTFVSFQ
jgi:hypothetical protein